MNFKRSHVSKNLLYESATTTYTGDLSIKTVANSSKVFLTKSTTSQAVSTASDVNISLDAGTYTISVQGLNSFSDNFDRIFIRDSNNNIVVQDIRVDASKTFTISSTTIISKVIFVARANSEYNDTEVTLMLNAGSTPLPYEPYSSEVWHDIPHYIMGTSTDTITTTPSVIYANDTTATIALKGDMVQSGTPTPTTPIQPSECGDLETTGGHAGQYKIPISSGNTTTSVYLGEVETTRKIKKLVITGNEGWVSLSSDRIRHILNVLSPDHLRANNQITYISSHYSTFGQTNSVVSVPDGNMAMSGTAQSLFIIDSNYKTNESFIVYLQNQYAAGTPVTIWYVLATEETGIVNEPIRKIGDYADEVSNISIPTSAGANTLSVGTTLQPSEVTATYKGWHPVQSAHEKTLNLFDESTAVLGKYIDSNGVEQTSSTGENNHSDYIPIKSGMQYTLAETKPSYDGIISAIAWYTSSKVFIQRDSATLSALPGRTSSTWNAPSNAAYAIINFYRYPYFDGENDMLNEGSTALPYEPYWT